MKMKYLFNIVLATVAVLALNSCLKKRETTLDGDGPRNVVEFKNTGSNSAAGTSFYPLYSQDLGSMQAGQSKSFNINVSYSGEDVAPSDITVELEVDQTALDRFNTENGTDYVTPPSSVCSYPTSLVIKKGQRVSTDSAKITLSADFDFDAAYALPLRIKSVSPSHTISANFGAAVYAFTLRNQYDGHYTVTGTMVDFASPGLQGRYPMDVYLITTGSNSVVMQDNAIGSPSHSIDNGGGLSYYGSFAPKLIFDPSGNGTIISVVNYFGQPAGNGRSAEIDPSGANKINLSDMSIDVNYWMNQPSVIVPHRTSFTEHFTYVGPR
jgi:hypothetical protein